MNQNKRATIKQVAKAAGVSTQTISRVINNRPDVSPETREHILQVIEALDYRPSALARSLIQQRSRSLGVVTAGLKYMGPSRTLNGIASQAVALGYDLLLAELPRFDTENVKPLLRSLLDRHVDGVVWAVPEVGDNHRWVESTLQEIAIPIIFLTLPAHPGLATVAVDNYAGAVLAVRHLLDTGRAHIGHVSGPLDWWEARERKRAWQETLAQTGRPAPDAHWTEANWSSASGETAVERLLDASPEIDAIFAGNDQMALSALRVAHRRRLRVPQDVAVVGFDNLAESAYFWPALTTVNQDQHELGCRAVKELVDQVEAQQQKKKYEPQNIWLAPELIVRESSVGQLT